MKVDVGKSKSTTYNLPKQDFVYGQLLARDKEGAKEVTETWKFNQESHNKVLNRDFAEFNKQSIHNGSVKSHAMIHSHQGNTEIEKRHQYTSYRIIGRRFQIWSRKQVQFLFIFKRPSTPMKLVIGNSYGIEAESVILDKFQGRACSQDSKLSSSIVKVNQASQLFYDTNHKNQQIFKEVRRNHSK